MYTMLVRSPRVTSPLSAAARASVCLSTSMDSPVRAASSTFSEAHSITRASAGTASPASSTITSPGTSASAFTVSWWPSRSTFAVAAAICCSASMAASALFSWYTPRQALISTTASMMIVSARLSPA